MSGANWQNFARVELRRLSAAFRGGCTWGTLGYALCLWVLVAGNLLFDGSFARTPFETLVALVAAAAYLLVTGLVFGLMIGLVAVGRAMAGRWVVLPVLAVPAGAGLALVLGMELLTERGQALLEAVTVAAVERDWLMYDAGKVGHAGPIALVMMLPLLFLDLGPILLDPWVLVVLTGLVLTMAALVLAGAVPAAALSLLVGLARYVRGVPGRWRVWAKIQPG